MILLTRRAGKKNASSAFRLGSIYISVLISFICPLNPVGGPVSRGSQLNSFGWISLNTMPASFELHSCKAFCACRVSGQHFQRKLWASIVAKNLLKPSDLNISAGRGKGWDLYKARSFVEKWSEQSPSTVVLQINFLDQL